MLMIPNGVPDEARSDPAVWQVQGTHHAENVPAKRVCPDDVLDHRCSGHAESLKALLGLEKDRSGSCKVRCRLSVRIGLMDSFPC